MTFVDASRPAASGTAAPGGTHADPSGAVHALAPGARTGPRAAGVGELFEAPPLFLAGATLWLVEAERWGGWAKRLAPRVLDGGEWRRSEELRRAADRRNYLVAHVALRVLLGERLGLAPEAVRLGRARCPCCGGPHGRPVVEGGGAHFSLSHGGAMVFVGLAPVVIGVDVERVPTPDVVADTAAVLHPDERAELAALDAESRPLAFARAWARKEAYLKGIGTGLGRSPALDYVGTRAVPASGPGAWTVRDVATPDDHAAAVALAREP